MGKRRVDKMGKRRVDKMGKRRVDKMGKRIVGKIAGSTSKRQFIRPIIQNEPQPSLQVPKRQFMRPGSQSVQQGQVLLPAQPAPEPQTIMHEPFPAPQRHFMPLTTQDVQQPLPLWCWKDRKSTRLNSSHQIISYAVFCL